MIKFLRKFRQQLLKENKTGRYLKYALGEIVLVVIGIKTDLKNRFTDLNALSRGFKIWY